MRRATLVAVLVALALALGAGAEPGLPAAAVGAPPATVPSLARAKIAYVHDFNLDAAEAYARLFSEFGATVILVDLPSIMETDFTLFDYVVIGADTGLKADDGLWGLPGAADEARILAAGRTILGLGEGGALFWDSVNVASIGWGLSAYFDDEDGVIVRMPQHPAWTGPDPVEVTKDQQVVLYSPPSTALLLFTLDGPCAATCEGESPGAAGYFGILRDGPGRLQWGYQANPDTLTAAGRFALTNMLASAPRGFTTHRVAPQLVATR